MFNIRGKLTGRFVFEFAGGDHRRFHILAYLRLNARGRLNCFSGSGGVFHLLIHPRISSGDGMR